MVEEPLKVGDPWSILPVKNAKYARDLTEAARDLGAPPLRVFFDITLPLIAPSLLAGWVLSLTISLDDVIMSAFLSGPETTTLPLVLLSRMRLGLNPEINAIGTLIIAVVTLGVVANSYYLMKREQRQARNLRMAVLNSSSEGRAAQSPPT